MRGKADNSLKGWTVDTRGVFGPVAIECLGKNSCDGLSILFQSDQNYGYDDDQYHLPDQDKRTDITLICARSACNEVMLLQADDTGTKYVVKISRVLVNI